MKNLNIPALDVQAADEGRYFHYMNGVHFKIARYGNPNHAKGLRILLKRYEGETDATDLKTEIAELMVDTVLLDWKGMTNGETPPSPVDYSRDLALELMLDDEYIHLQGWIEKISKDMANFYKKESDKTVK